VRKMGNKTFSLLADALTLFRGVVIPLYILFLIAHRITSFTYLLILLALGWISDWYDGTLARKSGMQSKIGKLEIAFDHIFICAISFYLIFVVVLPWWLLMLLSLFLFLSTLALYGTFRHQKRSYVGNIEIPLAPIITAAIFVYTIFCGSPSEKWIASAFLVLAIFHLKIGLKAKDRAREILSTSPADIKEAIDGLKLYFAQKRQKKDER